MLDIKITLKSMDEITPLLETSTIEEEAGILQTNGIEWIEAPNETFSVEALETEYQDTDILLTTGDYVHPSWVKSATLDGEPITIPTTFSRFLKLKEDLWLDTASNTTVTDLPTCSVCGAALDTEEATNICNSCVETLTAKKNYSWKPSPFTFIGDQKKKDQANPIWYGLELEYGVNSKGSLAEFMHGKENLYLKDDGSITGGSYHAELVSQPHSFTALMANDSWINELPTIDAEQHPDRNGCHIHISRTSFVSDKHYSLFYFLLNSNPTLLQFIGCRPFTRYCKHRVIGKVHSKRNEYDEDYERESVVNEKNKNTIETRFFNSTNDPDQVKSYIQFLDSLIKYTKYHGDEVSLTAWKDYVTKYSVKYKELVTKLETFEGALTEVIIFREPTKAVETIKSLTISEINNIISIKTVSGDTYVKKESKLVGINGTTLSFDAVDYGYYETDFSNIAEITVERM